VEQHPSVAAALGAARAEAAENDLILVTGSLYTVADARPPTRSP
jgi:folylpolyglutamate synthase/dihydropteroate synthase